jgi:hypothetical protein
VASFEGLGKAKETSMQTKPSIVMAIDAIDLLNETKNGPDYRR